MLLTVIILCTTVDLNVVKRSPANTVDLRCTIDWLPIVLSLGHRPYNYMCVYVCVCLIKYWSAVVSCNILIFIIIVTLPPPLKKKITKEILNIHIVFVLYWSWLFEYGDDGLLIYVLWLFRIFSLLLCKLFVW